MRIRSEFLAAALIVATTATAAWAHAKRQADEVEGKIKAACFRYYAGTVVGDADLYLKSVRLPLTVVRDGAITHRDEKETRALLAEIKTRIAAARLTEDDRKRITGNMVAMFDDSPLQFVGANTASLTFLIKRGEKPEDGDHLGILVLYRSGGEWKVIEEITDTAGVPPAYLAEPAKPKP